MDLTDLSSLLPGDSLVNFFALQHVCRASLIICDGQAHMVSQRVDRFNTICTNLFAWPRCGSSVRHRLLPRNDHILKCPYCCCHILDS